MAPEDRREMIVDAAIPLILEHGERVTTRQIADAAGIAEGTIFRAFADKDDVINAVVVRAIDPTPLDAELATIDLGQSLDKCVAAAVAAIQSRVFDTWRLLSAVGPRFHPAKPGPRPPLPALVRLFEAHRDRISVTPVEAAQRLRAVTLAATHPILNERPMSSRDVAKQFLYGVHVRSGSC
jgi:AcrR family transcriptional regulator